MDLLILLKYSPTILTKLRKRSNLRFRPKQRADHSHLYALGP